MSPDPLPTPPPAPGTKAPGPQWYTIGEAAAYLQVAEPTLYRWMRENRIAYRKVGDATRFLQEDLDGMVQLVPRATDLEKIGGRCPRCGHAELIDGHLQSTGLIYFRPGQTKFWTYRDADVKTRARMCARCGAISWFGDPEKLARLRPPPPPAAAGGPPACEI